MVIAGAEFSHGKSSPSLPLTTEMCLGVMGSK